MSWNRLIDGLKAGSARSGRPAPQKPLLLIYLLARAGAGLENGVEFAELQKRFRPWLSGLANSKAPDPLLPFWHMQGDGGGGWRVEPADGYSMQKGANRPTASSLKERGARGFLAPELWGEVAGDLGAAAAIARQVCSRWLDPEVAAGAMERFQKEAAGPGAAGGAWTAEEFTPLIEAYMAMLRRELSGESINKAETRRRLIAAGLDRTEGSIERKMQNVSSVLDRAGLPWIQGYKPLPNAQGGDFGDAILAIAKAKGVPAAYAPTADRVTLERAVAAIRRKAKPVPKPMGNLRPDRVTTAPREEVVRDPKVVAYALQRAGGCCEDCGEPGPFVRKSDGSVYLEVHHLVPLARGGSDTVDNAVAICPNCHRRLHLGVEGEVRTRELQALRRAEPTE